MGPPLLVHCSAGVGRTGTFITLDTMLQRMEKESDLNIYEFVTEMRKKRSMMVQTLVSDLTNFHLSLTCNKVNLSTVNAEIFDVI